MRVAFWWKLNWAWLCLIQTSLDESRQPILTTEIHPWPTRQMIAQISDAPSSSDAVSVKKEDSASNSPTQRSSDQDTISEPMDEVSSQAQSLPAHLQAYWSLAKKLNKRPRYPRQLAERQWHAIGDILVELGNELAKYGLLDMDLGLWENEIMHRIVP